jgi:hypothetical protein
MGYLVLLALLWFLLPRLVRSYAGWKARSAAERSFAVRFSIISWVLAFIFIAALLFLPNKGRIIMLVPVFLAGATLAKWWQTSRERLRQEAEGETNFARARRIN